ncbi:MAG: RHS repeat protein [Planctomycetales bacterium]|nr:MAG: RHS repeat protein [Planctomycetales bacterium]
MANSGIGIKSWRNYHSSSLFSGQRADRNTRISIDTYSGNLNVTAIDWNVAARLPISISRSYNHQDNTANLDRPFGPGWSWSYDQNLYGSLSGGSGTVTWKDGSGNEWEFSYASTSGGKDHYTSPAGMHKYVLSRDTTSGDFTIKMLTMEWSFVVNSTDSLARLMYIRDAFGNGQEIDRSLDGNSEPEMTINNIQIRYHNGSSWTTQDTITPTYGSGLITRLDVKYWNESGSTTSTAYKIYYSYTSIDSADRLTKVEPKDSSDTALNMEVEYDYNSSDGLEMTKIYDTEGSKAGTPYYWSVSYTSDKVTSLVFPIESGTTGTIGFDYSPTAPTGWPGSGALTEVTDARSNSWWYDHDTSGRVTYQADPLWTDTTHESEIITTWNSDNQVTEVDTPKPNNLSGRISSKNFYNSDKNLEVTQDQYGFLRFYKYGSRASYATSGTDATVDDIIGIFTTMPNQKAYADGDYTSSETTAPSSPDIGDVSWDNTNGYWYYTDAAGSPNTIKLVRTVKDPTFATGTGQLTEMLSCSPENFGDGGNPPTYSLTSSSACSKQEYNSTTGDLSKSYTPRQFQDSSLKWTAFTFDQRYGVMTEQENADSLAATANKKTKYTYNDTRTKQTKVELPEDNTNQWTVTVYDDREFIVGTQKPDIQSWSVNPQVDVLEYDYNGNLEKVYQADPVATGTRWDGNTANGYYHLNTFYYDRINRQIQSDVRVDWTQTASVDTLSTYYLFDANGNLERVKGPQYDDGGTDYYSYTFRTYDELNRADKSYLTEASTNSNLTSPSGAYSVNTYSVGGNVVNVTDPRGNATILLSDFRGAGVQTSRNYTGPSGSATQTTKQHFGANGQLYWSQNGEGYKMYPQYDDDSRRVYNRRGSDTGDTDEIAYDANSNQLYYYTYQDVDDSKIYRARNKYDLMDRMVNSGREQYTGGSWQNWNENTADTTFNYNGWVIRTYDKVNSSKYTESVYDNWGQTTKVKAPEVANPSGMGTIVYETENTYDVLGRRTSMDDHMDNTTSYTFDVLGRVIEVTDAESYDVSTKYDERGMKAQVTVPAGAVYKYTYDAQARLSRQRVTADSTDRDTDYTYDNNSNVTQVDYPGGGIQKKSYDELNRAVKEQQLLSGTDYLDKDIEYDDNNRMTKLTNPGGYETDYTYDNLGNLTQITDPNSDDTDFTYDLDNRRLTTTGMTGLVITNTYDWKIRSADSITYKLSASSGDDIAVNYTFDDNGRITGTEDGRGNDWTKAFDAMGRCTSLTTPNPGSGTYTWTKTYDGNSSITKTEDFAGNILYYQYDGLSRMTGYGEDSNADDVTYTYACCGNVTAYTDAQGTASISHDDLGRVTSYTNSQGNQVQYAYDTAGRISRVTGPRGSTYRTDYTYNKNGSVAQVDVYAGGSAESTTYTYDTSSGELTQRNFPTVSSANIRSTYSYDSAGKLQYETLTKETGSTTNMYRTVYSSSALTYGNQVVRTEQQYQLGTWLDQSRVTYKWDTMKRQTYEEREDYHLGSWSNRYDISQEYDKNGNRTRMHRNVASGFTSSYGQAMDLSYTMNAVNAMTQITDADDANYNADVTCDANNNITEIDESIDNNGYVNHLYSYFDVNKYNQLTAQRDKKYVASSGKWQWTKRSHSYNGPGSLVASNYKQWYDGDSEPAGSDLEHVYERGKMLQNFDGSSTYGTEWRWAGSLNAWQAALRSPNADSSSQNGYNLSNNATPQRRSFLSPTSEGDQRHLYGQGKPQAKDSTGGGANWYLGVSSEPTTANHATVESRLFFQGTVTATDMSRATDAREDGRIGITGSSQAYAGSYGRVTSEPLGRDINPMGRGDGKAYVGGALSMGWLYPAMPMNHAQSGSGFSSNNSGGIGLGGGGGGGCMEPPEGYNNQGCQLCDHYTNECHYMPNIWPPKEPCPGCTAEEWNTDPCGCKRKVCSCTCKGCNGANCKVPDNCGLYVRLGCGESAGNCIPSYWAGNGWECISNPNPCDTGNGTPQCPGCGTANWGPNGPGAGNKGNCEHPEFSCWDDPPCNCKAYEIPSGKLSSTRDYCLWAAMITFCPQTANRVGIGYLARVLRCIIWGETQDNPRPNDKGDSSSRGLFQVIKKWCDNGECTYAWSKVKRLLPSNVLSDPNCKYDDTSKCHDMHNDCDCFNIACGVHLFCNFGFDGNLNTNPNNDVCTAKGTYTSMNARNYNCCVCNMSKWT